MATNQSDKQTNSRRKAPKTAFKPGQSGNPRGRPKKGSAIADILNAIGDEDTSHGQSKREAYLRVIYDAALKGSLPHAEFITNRTEGKALERILKEKTNDEIEIL